MTTNKICPQCGGSRNKPRIVAFHRDDHSYYQMRCDLCAGPFHGTGQVNEAKPPAQVIADHHNINRSEADGFISAQDAENMRADNYRAAGFDVEANKNFTARYLNWRLPMSNKQRQQ